jgi:hypothetical protein
MKIYVMPPILSAVNIRIYIYSDDFALGTDFHTFTGSISQWEKSSFLLSPTVTSGGNAAHLS